MCVNRGQIYSATYNHSVHEFAYVFVYCACADERDEADGIEAAWGEGLEYGKGPN
jgi:hypothetical protein